MTVGQSYTMTLKQRAAHGKRPWVEAIIGQQQFSGKCRREETAADGFNYLVVPSKGGTHVFRIDRSLGENVNRDPIIQATLFMVY